jgi:hypothetical protein
VLQRSILRTTDHVNFFTRGSVTSLLESGGLAVREVRTEGFFLPHLRVLGWLRGARFGERFLERAGELLPSQAAGLIAVATREQGSCSA